MRRAAPRACPAWRGPGRAADVAGPSSIDQLPADVREALNGWLRDPGLSQIEATARTNLLLAELGQPPVSRQAVNRYDLRMREAGRRLVESRQTAEMWIGKLGAAPQGQLGHLVNEILRTLAFDLSLRLQDGELNAETIPGVIEQLKSLSLAMRRLESAATDNVAREREIRRQAAEAAAETVANVGGKRGLSAEAIAAIRRELLGMK